MTIEEMKVWIDNASYEELLRKWRFAPAGSEFFRNDTGMGRYASEKLAEKRKLVGHDAAVSASKSVGWE